MRDALARGGLVAGATILEIGEWGIRQTTWSELELVRNWRALLDAPERYLRHIVG